MSSRLRGFVLQVLAEWSGQPSLKRLRLSDVIDYMHRPVDAASLGVCRAMFGLAMLIDIAEERGGSQLEQRWSDADRCLFPIVTWIRPLSVQGMSLVYATMWLVSLGIAAGYRFRQSAALFALCYWYIFLLDRSVWNNHSYLFGLLAVLYASTDANRYCSLDAWNRDKATTTPRSVPFWNYFLLKYQFFILYFFAGLKKMNSEWLSGYAMSNLSYHWVFGPFRYALGAALTDLLVVHWFGWFFDLTVAFALVWRPTRRWAAVPCVAFHLMNAALFRIGMFPWVCLVQLPLFWPRDWPLQLTTKWSKSQIAARRNVPNNSAAMSNRRKSRTRTTGLIFVYCILQAGLPFAHRLTPGYTTWTDGPYGYSWDMMVHAWDTVHVAVRVRDNANGRSQYVNTSRYAANDRWSKHADMTWQFAQCLASRVRATEDRRHSANLSVFVDAWCSLNGRFQQRVFDPTVDVLTAPWSPWRRTPWVLPLLSDLAALRAEMTTRQSEAENEVLFVADFPGLEITHFVSAELSDVRLSVMQGRIEHYAGGDSNGTRIETQSEPIQLRTEEYHTVKTVGDTPAAYLYTYRNQTSTKRCEAEHDDYHTISEWTNTMWTLLRKRIDNYSRFLAFTLSCLLQIN